MAYNGIKPLEWGVIGIVRWVKVLALAALVSLAPVFAQVGYAQAVREFFLVIPFGEKLSDQQLLEVEGAYIDDGQDLWFAILLIFAGGAFVGGYTYYKTGDPWYAAESALVTMTLLVIGAAMPIPR